VSAPDVVFSLLHAMYGQYRSAVSQLQPGTARPGARGPGLRTEKRQLLDARSNGHRSEECK
jgi:hypothetical protein